jgi:hypothetical protein
VPTAYRTLAEITRGGTRTQKKLAAAISAARRCAWAQVVAWRGTLPGVRVADKTLQGVTCIRIDATVTPAHSPALATRSLAGILPSAEVSGRLGRVADVKVRLLSVRYHLDTRSSAQRTVPALACVAGDCGVRSPGKCPRAPVPSGGYKLGKAGRVNVSESSMTPRHQHSRRWLQEAGEQGPAVGRRRVPARRTWLAGSAPLSLGFRGHPPRPYLSHAERDNPDGVRRESRR